MGWGDPLKYDYWWSGWVSPFVGDNFGVPPLTGLTTEKISEGF